MNGCWKVDDKIPVEDKLKPVLDKLGDFENHLNELGTTYFAGKNVNFNQLIYYSLCP